MWKRPLHKQNPSVTNRITPSSVNSSNAYEKNKTFVLNRASRLGKNTKMMLLVACLAILGFSAVLIILGTDDASHEIEADNRLHGIPEMSGGQNSVRRVIRKREKEEVEEDEERDDQQQQPKKTENAIALTNINADKPKTIQKTNKVKDGCDCLDCDSDLRCGRLWRGGAFGGNAANLTVTILLYYCDQDLKWLNGYIGNIKIKEIVVVSKCGKKHNLPQRLTPKTKKLPFGNRIGHVYSDYMTYVALEPSRHQDPNHFIVFLKESRTSYLDGDWRTFQNMLRVASVNGFACGFTPPFHLSVYHNTTHLAQFTMDPRDDVDLPLKSSSNHHFKSDEYPTMKEWLREMQIELPQPYTPVCYSNIFAVKAKQIRPKEKIIEKIQKSLSRPPYDNDSPIEEEYYAERVWAGLFSTPLKEYQVEALRSYAERSNGVCCHVGALVHDVYDDF